MISKLCLIHALFAKLLKEMPGMHDETAPEQRRGLEGGSAASNNPFHFHMLKKHTLKHTLLPIWVYPSVE